MQFELKDVKQHNGSKTKSTVVSGRLILNGDNDLENFNFVLQRVVRDDSQAGVRYDGYGRPKPQFGYNVSFSYPTVHDFSSLLEQYTKKNNPTLHEFKNLEIPFSYEIIGNGKFRIVAATTSETKVQNIKVSKIRLSKKTLHCYRDYSRSCHNFGNLCRFSYVWRI